MRAVLRGIFDLERARPFQSLASRIIFFVFASTLMTSLVVTWVSTQSIQNFLRDKIDQKFPAILQGASERLDIWYGQRTLDIQTFARSAIIGANVARLGRSERLRTEVSDYLSYVLERFPQYQALFVLDPKGQELFWVGERVELAKSQRAQLVDISRPGVSDIIDVGDRRVQVASAVITDPRSRPIGTLHALLEVASVYELLQSDRLGPTGGVFLVSRDGRYLTPRPSGRGLATFDRPLPEPGEAPRVRDYTNAEGVRVVGSAVRMPRFGWNLVVEEDFSEAFHPSVIAVRRVLLINLATVLLFSGIAFWIALSVAKPIQALGQGARRIADGETDVVIDESNRTDEIGLLTRTFNRMAARLHRNRIELQESRLNIEAANVRLRGQNEELQRMNEALEQLSITDGLTKLYNHRFFQENLTREIARVGRTAEPLALILIDIDNFKQFNDRYGHAAGDRVLCDVARIMSTLVRESDVLARYGGEEFAIVPGRSSLAGAVGLAEKIRLAISETDISIESEGEPMLVRVTVSIGVAAYRGDRRTFFNDADRALYRAKAAGKDCVIVETGEVSSVVEDDDDDATHPRLPEV